METPQIIWSSCCSVWLTVKEFFLGLNGTSGVSGGGHYLFSFHWTPLRWGCFNLHELVSFRYLNTLIRCPQAFSSWGSTISALSLSNSHTKVCQMNQYFKQLSDASMDSLQYVHVSLSQEGAELGIGLQLWYHQNWIERKDAFSQPARNTLCKVFTSIQVSPFWFSPLFGREMGRWQGRNEWASGYRDCIASSSQTTTTT